MAQQSAQIQPVAPCDDCGNQSICRTGMACCAYGAYMPVTIDADRYVDQLARRWDHREPSVGWLEYAEDHKENKKPKCLLCKNGRVK